MDARWIGRWLALTAAFGTACGSASPTGGDDVADIREHGPDADSPDEATPESGADADADSPDDAAPESGADADADADADGEAEAEVEACSSTCGNDRLECFEECDDGNTVAGDGCDTTCVAERPPHCGNSTVDYGEGEQCDDGNTDDDDGCSPACRIEAPTTCGDGAVDLAVDEQCDDGNVFAGDGCSPACRFEPVGGHCGDVRANPGEVCDDGNTTNGDGCNPTCNLEGVTSLFVGSPGAPGFVDGDATVGRICDAAGCAGGLVAAGGYLYFADSNNFAVRRIDIATRQMETIAGDPARSQGRLDAPNGLDARFDSPAAITTDGVTLWVSDGGTYLLRTVSLTPPHAVETVAGSGIQGHADGIDSAAQFDDLRGLTYFGGYVYLLDGAANTLRRFDPVTREVTTLAGQAYTPGRTDSCGGAALLDSPRYMTSDGSGMLYFGDNLGHAIRAFNTVTDCVTTFAGDGACGYVDGLGTLVRIHRPRGMASDGTSIYWVETDAHTIRQGILATGAVSTLIATPAACSTGCTCSPAPAGSYLEGTGALAQVDSPFLLAFDFPTNSLFFLDAGNAVIRRIR